MQQAGKVGVRNGKTVNGAEYLFAQFDCLWVDVGRTGFADRYAGWSRVAALKV